MLYLEIALFCALAAIEGPNIQSTEMEQYPSYGTTYSLYRVSPLYYNKSPLLSNLNIHARRLRDEITGDVMRGIQVSNQVAGISSSNQGIGSFQSCSWDLLADENTWETVRASQDDSEDEISGVLDVTPQDAVGIHVQIRYEKATYSALLLGDANKKSETASFVKFPLMLLKMPVSLRHTFVNYLTTTFDTRIISMKLRPNFLGSLLERILAAPLDTSKFPKGLQLQLAFPSVSPNLRSLDIALTQEDLVKFMKLGNENWAVSAMKEGSVISGPFTTALSMYLMSNLALDFAHPAVAFDKFAVGPFAFTSEGKIKMTESSPESQDLWNMILNHARSSKLTDND